MKLKINLLTIFLLGMILVMTGLSFFIVLKIKEENPTTTPTRTIAADVTYRKLIVLKQSNLPNNESFPTPTEIPSLTPPNSEISPLESISPTEIQLLTTPPLTLEPSMIELAYNNLPPTEIEESLIATNSPTIKQIIKDLPQSGIYIIPLLIILFASALIFLSFML